MNEKLEKLAKQREARVETLYTIDEDWSNYGPNCPVHVGVRRLHVSGEEKVKLGHSQTDVVWQCPVDGEIFAGEGSIADQTSGFAQMNNTHRNVAPITDDGFDAAKKFSKAMGYAEDLD